MMHARKTPVVLMIAFVLPAGCMFSGSFEGFFGEISGDISILGSVAEKEFNVSTPAQDVGSLTVEWEHGTITVRVDDQVSEITASGTIEVRASTDTRATETLDELDVVLLVAESIPLQVFVRFTDPGDVTALFSADVEVVLPPGISVNVNNDNGNVSVTGNADSTTVWVTNGSIAVSEQSGDATLETTNGRIDVDSLAGSVEATSRNGSIAVNARPQSQQSVVAKTVNGQVSIFVPADTSASMILETTLGFIDLMLEDFTVTDLRTTFNEVSANLNGGGGQISGETVNGIVTFGSL